MFNTSRARQQLKYSRSLVARNKLVNSLEKCKSKHRPRFLQTAQLPALWYMTFRCLTLREMELAKRNWKSLSPIIKSVWTIFVSEAGFEADPAKIDKMINSPAHYNPEAVPWNCWLLPQVDEELLEDSQTIIRIYTKHSE
ncbi:hypothetical protein CHS0354_001765 [Potamilus streckersoni]|uniref:Uncharacterized protein n=1 Tax=Potamilus streckersoni TaxID=2493646 RepID=A0AAE0SIG8_9BIVA|nr:hypothetical protein CHS0354_001765 [Potamilus streckersoni]